MTGLPPLDGPAPRGPVDACVGRWAAELADGRLSGDAADRAWAHVATCPRCRDAVRAQAQTRVWLRSTPAPAASESLIARLTDTVPLPPVPPEAAVPPASRSLPRAVAAAGGAAAACLLALVASTPSRPAPDAVPGPAYVVPAVDRLTAAHAALEARLPLTGPGVVLVPVADPAPAPGRSAP